MTLLEVLISSTLVIAVMGAAAVVIPPTETPGWTDNMRFCQALGVTGGVIDWSPLLDMAIQTVETSVRLRN